MRFGEVLVLTYEYDCRNPKLFHLVLLDSIANDFGLTYVSVRLIRPWIPPGEYVYARFLDLLARKEFFELGSRGGNGFPTPVRDFSSAKAFGLTARKEELDSS